MRVARIPDEKAITTLGNKYGIIQSRIKKQILSVSVLNYSLAKVAEVKAKINEDVQKLSEIAQEFSKKYIPSTYDDMKKKSVVSLRVLGRKPNEGWSRKQDENTMQGRIDEMNRFMMRANKSINALSGSYFSMLNRLSTEILKVQEFANLSPDDEAELLSWITEATEAEVWKGASRNTLAAKIMDYLSQKVSNGNFISIGGRTYNLKKYSMMVARTELRRTQTDAVKEACNQYDNDLVEVSDHGTETEICKEFEGHTYSLSGSSQRYPEIEEFPPFHPNCQHFLYPTSEEAIEFGG